MIVAQQKVQLTTGDESSRPDMGLLTPLPCENCPRRIGGGCMTDQHFTRWFSITRSFPFPPCLHTARAGGGLSWLSFLPLVQLV